MTPDSTQKPMQPQRLKQRPMFYSVVVVAALLLPTHPQVQVPMPMSTAEVVQQVLIPLQVPQQVPMLAVDVEAAQQVPIHPQVPVQVPMVDAVAQLLLTHPQVQVQVLMSMVDTVAALQALIPHQVQVQAPMVDTMVVQPQQILPHHQVLQLTLIGLINNQIIQTMILAMVIIQDAIIHSIVTAIGFVFASAN
jgi:hypothetical protein